jgi:hypothetical protein
VRTALRLVPLCVLSLLLAAAALRPLLPVPDEGGLAAKLRAWEACRDGVDVLFVGSSRVAHGVVPEEFDAVLAGRGRPLRSFNLGVDGMGSFETDALLRRVLADPPARLAHVLVELDSWRPPARDLWTERAIRWHDLRLTLAALHSIRIGQAMLALKLETARVHLAHFAMRALNLGLGRLALVRALAPPAPPPGGAQPPTTEALLATRGFQPYPARDASGPVFRGDAQAYARAVQGVTGLRSVPRHLELYNRDALLSQAARLQAAGVRPVYFVTPTLRAMPYVEPLQDAGLLPALLAFHRPERHPGLFALPLRHDEDDHLNEDGARAFTRELAEAFAELPVPPGR